MKAPRGRDPWASLVFVLGLAGLIVMADNWVVSPLLPSIAEAMGSSVAEAQAPTVREAPLAPGPGGMAEL